MAEPTGEAGEGPLRFGPAVGSDPGVFLLSTTDEPPPKDERVGILARLGSDKPKPLVLVWPKGIRHSDGSIEILTFIALFGLKAMPAYSVDPAGVVRRRRGYWFGLGLPLLMVACLVVAGVLLVAADFSTASRLSIAARLAFLVVIGGPILLFALRRWRRASLLLDEATTDRWRRVYRSTGEPLLPPANDS